MKAIQTIEDLEAIYGEANPVSLSKVVDHISPKYHDWISKSRFVILSTIGPGGTDASPRGDDGPVVTIDDPKTLLLPDWRGNNRLDSLRNIVVDNRVSLMFMAPGSNNVIRINGTGVLTADEAYTSRFEKKDKMPQTVLVITVGEIYFQCAKAIMRSELWSGEDLSRDLPSAGDFLKERNEAFGQKAYDDAYPAYAAERMW